MLHSMIDKLCGRIDAERKLGRPISMRRVYLCLTTNIITLYGLNHSWNLLDTPDFSPAWLEMIQSSQATLHLLRHFPFILSFFLALPDTVLRFINPGAHMIMQWRRGSICQLQLIDGT